MGSIYIVPTYLFAGKSVNAKIDSECFEALMITVAIKVSTIASDRKIKLITSFLE